MAAGGALFLALAAWLVQRRRQAMIAETESILLAAERESQRRSQLAAAKALETPPPFPAPQKASFLSEFTPSDFDAIGIDTDEVNPISEADVYLAYGRYKQAEELIRHAILQHPENNDFKLKLLEIYYTTENRTGFESYARELKAQHLDAQADFWSKVEQMGHELLPESPLFQTGRWQAKDIPRHPTPSEAADPLVPLDLSDDLIDDLKRFEVALPVGTAADQQPEAKAGETAQANAAEEQDHAPLEFDLAPAKPEARPSQAAAADRPAPAPPSPVAEPKAQEAGEQTIDDLLRELEAAAAQAAEPGSPEEHVIDFDLPLTGPAPEATSQAEASEAAEDRFAGLTDMDPFETKLDLARAYADMEDEDSAREILEEVAAKGSDRQRAEATRLLEQLRGAKPAEPQATARAAVGAKDLFR
ncbi:FimV/HubP family polar landmark protein [Candidatus Methylocalor cossyra]